MEQKVQVIDLTKDEDDQSNLEAAGKESKDKKDKSNKQHADKKLIQEFVKNISDKTAEGATQSILPQKRLRNQFPKQVNSELTTYQKKIQNLPSINLEKLESIEQ